MKSRLFKVKYMKYEVDGEMDLFKILKSRR